MTARSWLVALSLFSTVLHDAVASRAEDKPAGKMRVYVGTYTGPKSQGIYRLELDLATGKLSEPKLAGEEKNPSFLAIHPNQKFLYAVSEISDIGGKKTGGVTAFAIDPASGDLKKLNQQSSGGSGPCHCVVDRAGKNVLVANYGGGNVGVLPIGSDGSLEAMSGFAQHEGIGGSPGQKAPRAHSINVDAGNHFAMAADAGIDKVMVYRFDAATGKIAPNEPPFVHVGPATAPRHFAFHPDGKHAYVINEMSSSVTAFDYDSKAGELKIIDNDSTLPADFKGNNSTAEVQVHPSGKFVYGSNRGHNSIAIFSVDAANGKLTPAGHQAEGIKTPRNFGIDPTGAYLIVGNQDGGNLLVFRVDPNTGALTPTGAKVEIAAPVCVKFMRIDS